MKVKNRVDSVMNTSFGDFQSDIESLIGTIFGGAGCTSGSCETGSSKTWKPRTDVTESETAYTLEIELPGVSPEDVNVELREGRLEVRGSRVQEELPEGTKSLRRERVTGEFARRFEFSQQVDADKTTAEFKFGILKLNVPKSEKELPRKIEIKTAE